MAAGKQKKKRIIRPNSFCLVCDEKDLQEPNYQRVFYTCSEYCCRAIHKGISSLSMKNLREKGARRNYSQNGYQLACAYFVLRKSNQTLSGLEVIDRVRDNFGKKRSFKTNSFTHLFPFFENNVERKKINGSFHYCIVDKTIPFNKVLKSKYAEYLFDERV
jgi:hypothetical protein